MNKPLKLGGLKCGHPSIFQVLSDQYLEGYFKVLPSNLRDVSVVELKRSLPPGAALFSLSYIYKHTTNY